jgi:hypothetical protein
MGLDLDRVRGRGLAPAMVRVPITALVLDRRPARLALLRLLIVRLSNTKSCATVAEIAKSNRGAPPIVFVPRTLVRTWGTRPVPFDRVFGLESQGFSAVVSHISRKTSEMWGTRGSVVGTSPAMTQTPQDSRKSGSIGVCGQDRDLPSSLVSAFLEVGRAQEQAGYQGGLFVGWGWYWCCQVHYLYEGCANGHCSRLLWGGLEWLCCR